MNWRELVTGVLNTGAGLVGQKYQADIAKANANAANRAAAAEKSTTPKWLLPAVIGVAALIGGVVLFKSFSK